MTELLAPAQNKECAIAAIQFGADAVYIGATAFGARKNVPNSLYDIEEIVNFAHRFYAKVYVTINTILDNNEIISACKLIHKLYEIGVDAVIIQDFGLLELNLPPIPLHISTQADNSSLEKVKFFDKLGVKRVILARELSLEQIKEIRNNTNVELEVFIHGALCVSFSGQCYMSFANGGRSANRGECAQPCRKKYSLFDEAGNCYAKDKYLLSLKDFNASDYIKNLIDLGVQSFKIEGRLKNVDYVKNNVAHYRKLIDKYSIKDSSGTCFYDFDPNPEKTFNRGFCSYFMEKRDRCYNFLSQKSLGEKVGIVKNCTKDYIKIEGKKISAQDGLCWFENEQLKGCLINKTDGNKIYPAQKVYIKPETEIYRNFDAKFQKELLNSKTTRKIGVEFFVNKNSIKVVDENNNKSVVSISSDENALNQQKMRETYVAQLHKTGDSDFFVQNVNIDETAKLKYLKLSQINELRRNILENLMHERLHNYKRILQPQIAYTKFPFDKYDFRANVHNRFAEGFYKKCDCEITEYSLETTGSVQNKPLMRTKHCLKYAFGLCKSSKNLFLTDEKGQKYELKFDCQNCQMLIYRFCK